MNILAGFERTGRIQDGEIRASPDVNGKTPAPISLQVPALAGGMVRHGRRMVGIWRNRAETVWPKSENIDLSGGIVYDKKDCAFGRIVGASVPVYCRE